VLQVSVKENEMTDGVVTKANRHYASAGDWRTVGITEVTGIVFPDQGQLRSRKVVKRSNARPTGKYPSWKMGRMLQWESENELNAFRLLDCDPDVTSFNEQPCEILYVLNGQTRSHFPDILVQKSGCKEFWEVKPESKAMEPGVLERTSLMINDLPRWGYSYQVALARDLALQPRQRSVRVLLDFGRRTATGCEREFIRRTFNQRGSVRWGDACRGEFGLYGREILCNLVLRGVLSIDMLMPISQDTRFVARKGEL
jgi:hypothetical protein